MEIEQHILGFTPDNEAVIMYQMINAHGANVRMLNTGAALVSVEVPDREGRLTDVLLGYPLYEHYLKDASGLGKTTGRYTGRIGRGKFTIGEKQYQLPVNALPHHLNGGNGGLSSKVWTGRVETDRVVFSYVSPAEEEGYPGDLTMEVVYDWDDENQLEITYYAKSEALTPVNLSIQPFFNLNGEGTGDVLSHRLTLRASHYLPQDATLLPTGELAPVTGTPMDFTREATLSECLKTDFLPLQMSGGLSHYWTIDHPEKGKFIKAARLQGDRSGIHMDVYTTYPGICVNSGTYLTGTGKSGASYQENSGVALICSHLPDAPNRPQFPAALLHPDELYEQHILYKFSVR